MSGNSGSGDAEFDAFVSTGDVEVGKPEGGAELEKGKEEEGGEEEGEKPAKRRGPPKVKETTTSKTADDEEGGEEEEEEEEGGEEDEKPKKTAKDHQIERLKREKRDLMRQLHDGGSSAMASRLEALEKRLTGENRDDTKTTGKKAPDPTDAEKYPLGHLDDRYIEDKLEWLADQKATAQADSVLQRQRESEQEQAAERFREALLEQVEDLSAKGSELYENFQEDVVDTGMRGEWDLSQPTFEAAAEAEHGAQILYELSQDKKEAKRVAKLSPFQQLKFVQERDAEIGAGKKPRTKPQAGEPPKNAAKGASSKTQISPATDNLDDFEKAWERDAKGKK